MIMDSAETDEDTLLVASGEPNDLEASPESSILLANETPEESVDILDELLLETPEVSEKEKDGSVCFPASATVELESGAVVRMDDLSVGDMVKVGVDMFSRVFMFTHKMAGVKQTFVTLSAADNGVLTLTPGHYVYINGVLAAAKTAKVGDKLMQGNGKTSFVTSVDQDAWSTGLFNPHTVQGNSVVDSILASTHTTAVDAPFARAILSPLRLIFRTVGW